MVLACLVKNNTSVLATLYLADGLEKPLLGKPAIKKLVAVQQYNNIIAKDAQEKWSECFKGLWKLDGQLHIMLKSDTNPFALAC